MIVDTPESRIKALLAARRAPTYVADPEEVIDVSGEPEPGLPEGIGREVLDERVAGSPEVRRMDRTRIEMPTQGDAEEDDGLVLPGMPSAQPARRPTPEDPRATAARQAQAPLAPINLQEQRQKMMDRRSEAARTSRPTPINMPAQRQEMVDKARRAERTPEAVEKDARSVAERAVRQREDAASGERKIAERQETRVKDAAQQRDREAQNAYDAARREWETQLENAYETGNMELAAKLEKSKPQPPRPSLESTGGKTVEELQEPVEDTLDRLEEVDPDAAAALRAMDESVPDSLNAHFSDMPPDERLQAMQVAGQRLAAREVTVNGRTETRAVGGSLPTVVGLPQGRRGGMGRAGTQLMPPGRNQPRSAYDQGPGKPTGTPRSPMEDSDTGAPRRTPQNVDTFDGSLGPRAAPAPSTDDILEGVDLDAPEHTGAEKDLILLAAHQMGLDLGAFDDSPRGQAMALHEAKRLVRNHRQRVGTAGAPGKQRAVASDNPDSPYRYAETPTAKKERERRDLVRRTHQFIGNHPIPDSLRDEVIPDPTDTNPDDGIRTLNLHDQLLQAAANDDMETYHAIRQKLRGAEIAGQRAMLVQRRAMKAMQTQMTDPEINRGVFASAMADAGDDPEAQALVYRQFGMHDQADRVLALSSQDRALENQIAIAKQDADTRQTQAERSGKGEEQPQPNAIEAVDRMLAPIAAEAVNQPGVGAVSEAIRIGGAAGMSEQESARVFARRFLRTPGASPAHPVIQECMRREWASTLTLNLTSYGQQFIDNCVTHLGVSREDAMNWLKTHQAQEAQRLSEPAAAQAPMPPSMPVNVGGR
jgi:hypothetical protein